jgi:hypothetical protein
VHLFGQVNRGSDKVGIFAFGVVLHSNDNGYNFIIQFFLILSLCNVPSATLNTL